MSITHSPNKLCKWLSRYSTNTVKLLKDLLASSSAITRDHCLYLTRILSQIAFLESESNPFSGYSFFQLLSQFVSYKFLEIHWKLSELTRTYCNWLNPIGTHQNSLKLESFHLKVQWAHVSGRNSNFEGSKVLNFKSVCSRRFGWISSKLSIRN